MKIKYICIHSRIISPQESEEIKTLIKNNPSNVRTILTIVRDGRIYLEWYSWHEL